MAEAKSMRGVRPERPLSPHLQIYRPLINMVMSIVHRMTGVALYVGALVLAWWLIAASLGPAELDTVNGYLGSWLGQIVLIGLLWSLVHHALGGIRHFIWDLGRGYELATIDLLSWLTIVLSVVLTIVLWGIVIIVRGGF
jgi:succinate dehydrogenase / fumarate reductase, cytochrome b subunit